MAHVYGIGVTMSALHRGDKLVVSSKQVSAEVFDEFGVTHYFAVPSILRNMKTPPPSLKRIICAGSPLSKEEIQRLVTVFPNSAITPRYGMTEATGCISFRQASLGHPVNSVGALLPGMEAKLDDEGRLFIRGPNIMEGYIGNPSATLSAFKDGWLDTGDLGRFDENGCLYVIGRMKEIIKFKSNQVPSGRN